MVTVHSIATSVPISGANERVAAKVECTVTVICGTSLLLPFGVSKAALAKSGRSATHALDTSATGALDAVFVGNRRKAFQFRASPCSVCGVVKRFEYVDLKFKRFD